MVRAKYAFIPYMEHVIPYMVRIIMPLLWFPTSQVVVKNVHIQLEDLVSPMCESCVYYLWVYITLFVVQSFKHVINNVHGQWNWGARAFECY